MGMGIFKPQKAKKDRELGERGEQEEAGAH
jgi:hypothetical protein